MATFLPGITDNIHSLNLYSPDFAFINAVTGTLNKYRSAVLNALEEQYYYIKKAPLTRDENIALRNEYLKLFDEKVQKLASLNFIDNPEALNYAKSLIQPILENTLYVDDLDKTERVMREIEKANYDPTPNKYSIAALTLWSEEYKKASPASALSMQPFKYIPEKNWFQEAVTFLKKNGFEVKFDTMKNILNVQRLIMPIDNTTQNQAGTTQQQTTTGTQQQGATQPSFKEPGAIEYDVIGDIYVDITNKNGEAGVLPFSQVLNMYFTYDPEFKEYMYQKAYVDIKGPLLTARDDNERIKLFAALKEKLISEHSEDAKELERKLKRSKEAKDTALKELAKLNNEMEVIKKAYTPSNAILFPIPDQYKDIENNKAALNEYINYLDNNISRLEELLTTTNSNIDNIKRLQFDNVMAAAEKLISIEVAQGISEVSMASAYAYAMGTQERRIKPYFDIINHLLTAQGYIFSNYYRSKLNPLADFPIYLGIIGNKAQ